MKGENRIIVVIILCFLAGLILLIPCVLRDYGLFLSAPLFVFISLLLLYELLQQASQKVKFSIYVLFVFSSSLLFEIIAFKNGKIVGRFNYCEQIWLKFAGIPVTMGLKWFIMIAASNATTVITAHYLKIRSIHLRIFLAGGFLVLLYYFMEPVGMFLNYWSWSDGYVPVKSYLAWLILGVFYLYILHFFRIEIKGRLLVTSYLVFILYFMAMQVFLYPC